MVQWFKTMTTNAYIRGVTDLGWPGFDRRLWQRNYYEHIVCSDAALDRLRTYIAANPARWTDDQLHPDVPSRW
jgi:REP element-mobilizing transposase RayT